MFSERNDPMVQLNSSWTYTPQTSENHDFFDLFDNKTSAIIIDDFLPPENCSKIKEIAEEYGLHHYDYLFNDDVPEAFSLFDTHYLYEQKTPAEYCPKAEATNAQYAQFKEKLGFNPFEKVRAFLEEKTGRSVSIAKQGKQEYTHVILRQLQNSALLHADFAPFIPQYWSISDITSELAWNIYLTDPGQGGECVVYDKLWDKEDDQHILGETYGYDEIVVQNKDYIEIPITAGKLVFFNSRNFHKVNASSQMRLSIGGHIGLKPDGSLVMWV